MIAAVVAVRLINMIVILIKDQPAVKPAQPRRYAVEVRERSRVALAVRRGQPGLGSDEGERDPVASRLDDVIALAKRRGFVFQAGEIYGGTRSAWDYGPLGTELKENIKRQWWQSVVRGRDDVVGLDSSVVLPREM